MSQTVFRIGTDTPNYTAEDPSGEGARRTGGRWNREGLPVVYTSTSRALACLETLVHLDAGGLPLNRYLVEIAIPDKIWNAAERIGCEAAPVGWDALPAGKVSIEFGSDWLASAKSALLIVPSVIVPQESNVMINPLHPDAGTLSFTKTAPKWTYDPRLKPTKS